MSSADDASLLGSWMASNRSPHAPTGGTDWPESQLGPQSVLRFGSNSLHPPGGWRPKTNPNSRIISQNLVGVQLFWYLTIVAGYLLVDIKYTQPVDICRYHVTRHQHLFCQAPESVGPGCASPRPPWAHLRQPTRGAPESPAVSRWPPGPPREDFHHVAT